MSRLLIIVMLLFMAYSVQAQIQTAKESEKSKLETFSAKSGTLIEKTFIDVGKVQGIKIQILTLADLISKTKISGVRMEYYSMARIGGGSKVAFLDEDEVDGLIKSIAILKAQVFSSTRENYTEVIFSSRSGFQAGCYFYNGKWATFLRLERYDNDSSVTMTPDDFGTLETFLQTAKTKL